MYIYVYIYISIYIYIYMYRSIKSLLHIYIHTHSEREKVVYPRGSDRNRMKTHKHLSQLIAAAIDHDLPTPV